MTDPKALEYARRVLEVVVEPQRCDDGETRFYPIWRENGVRCDAAIKRAAAILAEFRDEVLAKIPQAWPQLLHSDNCEVVVEPWKSFVATT
jgi:hypothetical protein